VCEPNSTTKNSRKAAANTRRQIFLLPNVESTLRTIKLNYSPMAMMVARDDQTRRDYYARKNDLFSINAIVDLGKNNIAMLDLSEQFVVDLASF